MENLQLRRDINGFNSESVVTVKPPHSYWILLDKILNALTQKGHLLAYPISSVTSGFLSNQLLVSGVSISACLKKNPPWSLFVWNINKQKKKVQVCFSWNISSACLASATSPTSVRCSSLLCVNFTQIEFNPIDPSAGRAPESSPPDTLSPSSARGGALPRTSHLDKQAACAVTDPAVPVWRSPTVLMWGWYEAYIEGRLLRHGLVFESVSPGEVCWFVFNCFNGKMWWHDTKRLRPVWRLEINQCQQSTVLGTSFVTCILVYHYGQIVKSSHLFIPYLDKYINEYMLDVGLGLIVIALL